MIDTKDKLLDALERMEDVSNEIEVVLTYAEIKEFLLHIELSEVERKMRFEKLNEARVRHVKIKD